MSGSKQVAAMFGSPDMHWVGDGFPVSTVFSPRNSQNRISPYLLLDYAGPASFEPAEHARGVDFHPHRGFETVTIVYSGEIEHRDSAGHGGKIGPGDVQWMTAASGILHEEKHSAAFTQRGGVMEMAQLWVNLPAAQKMAPPRYQDLRREDIPVVALADGAGSARLIAGALHGVEGAARTFTPVLLWDVALRAGSRVLLPIEDGFHAAVFVRSGSVWVAGTHAAEARQLAVLTREGSDLALETERDSELLILGGRPIDEPVVAHGPFVMNTLQEIDRAIDDARSGRLGRTQASSIGR